VDTRHAFWCCQPCSSKLDELLTLVRAIAGKETTQMAAIDDLAAKVARNTSVTGSALALIQGFAAQLAAAGTDPTKLKALGDTLTANDDALAAAVAANTPAAAPAGS
jgi:hypothetical protein